ncbi:MAG: PQQ-like beta-propeller repeat protein [Candidatus Heimdallarchaeota archaeon]|nr:PQQ-like beta-propeller repeat protein [Candidatus Heimdallarchaeota archaeon]
MRLTKEFSIIAICCLFVFPCTFSTGEVLTGNNYHEIVLKDILSLSQLWSFATGGQILTSPAFIDVNSDENFEVVFGSNDHYVYCVDNTGTEVWKTLVYNDVVASPAVADLDLDGKMEVLVASTDGNLYCFDKDGSQNWEIFMNASIYNEPIVVDLDIDGDYEILVTDSIDNLICLNHMGEYLWYASHANYQGDLPVVGNIDETPELEIIVPGTTGPICYDYLGNLQYADNSWNMVHPQDIVLADLNRTGVNQLLFYVDVDTLVCVNASDPTEIYFQYFDISKTTLFSSPVVADVNSDDKLEIIIHAAKPGMIITESQGILYCFNSHGDVLWSDVMVSRGNSQPIVVDIDNNNVMDIIAVNLYNQAYCVNSTGKLIFNYDNAGNITNTPLVMDIDNDETVEILCPSGDGLLYCLGVNGVLKSGKVPWSRERCSTFNIGQADYDGDHIDDLSELFYNSNPVAPDTDFDQLFDWEEIYCYGTNPYLFDTDGDTIIDSEEVWIGVDGWITNPLLADTDGDGYNDNTEIAEGTNPTDPNDPPKTLTPTPTPTPTNTNTTPTSEGTLSIITVVISLSIMTIITIILSKKKRD